jgi:XTP/dITP diphosphohydrolase
MKTICFATNNQHKLEEVKHLLKNKFQIVSLQEIGCLEELPETQDTLEGNSLQKADFVFSKYNIPCFADDTGLEVESLGGAPGVYSARYAGEQRSSTDNIMLLLKNLQEKKNRKARFRTVITLKGIDDLHIFEGIVRGEIIREKKGTAGFGYDPVFQPEGYQLTFAEMSMDEKNKLSHRGLAIQKLIRFLSQSNP